MIRVRVNRQSSQRQAVDYAVAMALLLEMSVLYGSFKLAARLGLVHAQNGKVLEASIITLKEGKR